MQEHQQQFGTVSSPTSAGSCWGMLLPGDHASSDVSSQATPTFPELTFQAAPVPQQPQTLHRARTTPMFNVPSSDDLAPSSQHGGRDQGQFYVGSTGQTADPWQHLKPLKGTLRGAFRGHASEEWLAMEMQREVDDLARCVDAFSVVADSTLTADVRHAALQGQCDQLSRQRGQLASRVSQLEVLLPAEHCTFKRLHNELAAVEQECAANQQRLQLELTAKAAADELANDLRNRVAWLENQFSTLGLPLFQPTQLGRSTSPSPPLPAGPCFAPAVPTVHTSPSVLHPLLPNPTPVPTTGIPTTAHPAHTTIRINPVPCISTAASCLQPAPCNNAAAPCMLRTAAYPRVARQMRADAAVAPEAVLAAVQLLRSNPEWTASPRRATHSSWVRGAMLMLVMLSTALLTLLLTHHLA